MTDDPTEFIRASRERITEITSDASDIWMQGSLKDITLANYARTALPRALDIIEAQQREAEKWRDARDELARARRWDIDKLERQMDVVAEQLVVALRDGDALRKQLAEQQAVIEHLKSVIEYNMRPVVVAKDKP